VAPAVILDALVLSRNGTEQREVEVRVNVAPTAPEEPVVVRQPETSKRSVRQRACELIAERVVDKPVRVEEEDPRRRDAMLAQKPIAPRGEAAVPLERVMNSRAQMPMVGHGKEALPERRHG
jgi:hypothetical protein